MGGGVQVRSQLGIVTLTSVKNSRLRKMPGCAWSKSWHHHRTERFGAGHPRAMGRKDAAGPGRSYLPLGSFLPLDWGMPAG